MSNPALVSVYTCQVCLGFILSRGPAGFEAFSADEKSLGLPDAARGGCRPARLLR
jgi:hypothetical protein